MNGPDRSHTLASTAVPGLDASVSNGGVPSGTISNNSWLRDMVSDPVRAAQVGLLNPLSDNNHTTTSHHSPLTQQRSTFPSGLVFSNSLMQDFYNGSSMNSMMPPMQLGLGEQGHPLLPNNLSRTSIDQQRLLVPAATSSSASNNAALHVFTHPSYKTHSRESTASMSDADIPAKRMKMTSSASAEASSLVTHTAPSEKDSIPHRPEYFHRGSVIQLGENKLKRIEDLQTCDFETSANLSSNLSLDCSTLLGIVEDVNRGTAFLTFSVGDHKHRPVEATVEATLEHPFFVFDRGWSSVNPERTLHHYKMKCQQLKVQDRCISLTFKDNSSINKNSMEVPLGVAHPVVTSSQTFHPK